MLNFGKINLWKIEKEDLGHHYRWANDNNLRRLLGGPPRPRSFPQLESWYHSLAQDSTREVFSLKTEGAHLVGWAELSELDFRNGHAEVGIVVDEQERRQGYAHDGLVALLNHCFHDLRLHRVGAHVLSINTPSLSLFESLGFKVEGVCREFYFASGRHLDVTILGLLAQEFECPEPKS